MGQKKSNHKTFPKKISNKQQTHNISNKEFIAEN